MNQDELTEVLKDAVRWVEKQYSLDSGTKAMKDAQARIELVDYLKDKYLQVDE